jgi:hypothetical protein
MSGIAKTKKIRTSYGKSWQKPRGAENDFKSSCHENSMSQNKNLVKRLK